MLVATIPESDIEIAGEAGQETLARIEHTFGRMEAIWKSVGSEEGFEVVRRRLFLPLDDEPARDDVCRAFGALYRDHGGDFPAECREARYHERLKACLPDPPGGLRAAVQRLGHARTIPAHARRAAPDGGCNPRSVGSERRQPPDPAGRRRPRRPGGARRADALSAGGLDPGVEGDVDGPNSGPLRIDSESPRFGQTVATRRVARTIFLGSAPHVAQQRVRGVEDVRVRLGAVQPGEQVAVFNDALSQLSSADVPDEQAVRLVVLAPSVAAELQLICFQYL